MRVVELERSSRRTAHRHPHSEEVIYVVAGKGSVWIKGEVTMVGVGDTVHVPAGILHATVPDPGETMRLVCFLPHPDLVNNAEETDMEVSPDGEGER